MTVTPLITTDDALEQLDIDSDFDPAEIDLMVAAATEIINSRCGYSAPTPVQETVFVQDDAPFTRRRFILSHTPVLSLTSITPTQQGLPAPDMTQVVFDAQTGVVYLSNWQVFYGTFVVSYTAGRTSVPPALALACRIIVQHLWDTRRGAMGLPPLAGQDVSPNDDGIPYRALQLMNIAPYAAAPGIA